MTVCKWLRMALICAMAFVSVNAEAATTLLPNGKQCFSATTGITGMIGTTNTLVGGTLYTTGTYSNVPLTGGTGNSATATITTSGGAVTNVTILNPGIQYTTGDVLSAAAANLGGTGGGFSITVASTAINGSLASGQVNMFVPATTTPKATWQDSGQVALNTQPIILDANGCAVIYGVGIYRQQLLDSLGNLVWDQPTTDTSAFNSVFWAGLALGTSTPNAINVSYPGFNGTDGTVINFTALATNTTATTINPSGFGNVPVLKDTTAGPVALTGLEIIANNPVSVIYRTVDSSFHILNPVLQSASGATTPACQATGLKITNGSSPNTIIALTADSLTMRTSSGGLITRGSVSLTNINITTGTTTATANGMDGEVPGTSAWIYVYGIDNGAAPAGLVSTSATAPTLPSGYTYSCRLGAMRVDGSSLLLRTLQTGNRTTYTPVAATNTLIIPQIVATTSTGNLTTGPTWTAFSISNFVPPTATRINVILNMVSILQASSVRVGCAPSNTYGTDTSTNPPPLEIESGTDGTSNVREGGSVMGDWLLESSNVYCAGSAGAGGTFQLGAKEWTDKVNAN